jgi:hypothetical protein
MGNMRKLYLVATLATLATIAGALDDIPVPADFYVAGSATGMATRVAALENGAVATVKLEATSLTVTSAHYGKMIAVATNDAVALTLPANGATAGTFFYVTTGNRRADCKVSDSCAITIAAATQDTLIGPNDVDLDSVTWGAGHRIGCFAKVFSDGHFWHVLNLGGTTMTYSD